MYFTFLLCNTFIWLFMRVDAFTISIEENPQIFTAVPLTWTRDANDPTDFWFNALQVAEDGTLNKVLSLQVSNTGSPSGITTFVFVLTGPHVIQVATDENADVFNSTTPITAVASNSSNSTSSSPSSSCSPATTVTTTITASSTGTGSSQSSSTEATSRINSSVIIGATIGTVVPLTIVLAVIAVLCFRRRSAEHGSAPSDPSKNDTLFPTFRGRNNIVTPFVEVADSPISRSKEKHPSLFTTTRYTSSPTIHPSSPRSLSKKLVTRSNVSLSPATINSSGDNMAMDQSQRSRSSHVPTSTAGTVSPPTQRQQLLEGEAGRLRLEIISMVNQALSGNSASPEQGLQSQMAAEMERMKEQIERLEQDRDSAWAIGLSDEPPSYLTLITR